MDISGNKSYVLWHCQRQGWVSSTGTTSTEYTQAQRFGWNEAISRCKRVVDRDGTPTIVPVLADDIQRVLA